MSGDQFERCLQDLRATADVLSAASTAPPGSSAPDPQPASGDAQAEAAPGPSHLVLIRGTLARTAVALVALGTLGALADPLLPHPGRPSLAAEAVAEAGPPRPVPTFGLRASQP